MDEETRLKIKHCIDCDVDFEKDEYDEYNYSIDTDKLDEIENLLKELNYKERDLYEVILEIEKEKENI